MESNNDTNAVAGLLSGLMGRTTRTMKSLLLLLAAAVATWFLDSMSDRKVLHETVDEVRQAAESRLAPPKPRGTGAVSVTKSTDMSKPGGGVISEDDSWKEGLAGDASRPGANGKAHVEGQIGHVDFTNFRDGQWVTGVGTVRRVLDDDIVPPRHQRFILEDEFGNSVLVAHNIDQAARIDGLKAGDEIAFRGEYRTNERGGVIHWTHPDSSRRRQGGWLRRR